MLFACTGLKSNDMLDASHPAELGDSSSGRVDADQADTRAPRDDLDACTLDCTTNIMPRCSSEWDHCDGGASPVSLEVDASLQDAPLDARTVNDDAGADEVVDDGSACVPNCVNESTARCDDQNVIEICANLNDCLRWVHLSPCPDASICSNATCVTPSPPQLYEGWVQTPGSARDIAVGAEGSLWIIGTTDPEGGDYPVHKWTGLSWIRVSVGKGVRIAVDPKGVPWLVNSVGEIYEGTSNEASSIAWGEPKPGLANDVAIGADGSVWLIGTLGPDSSNFYVYKWNGSNWDLDQTGGAGVRISVGPTGEPWIIDSSGRILRRTSADPANGAWVQASPDLARDLSVGASDVWILGTANIGNNLGFTIRMVPGAAAGDFNGEAGARGVDAGEAGVQPGQAVNGAAVSIAAGPDAIWIINRLGDIFRRVP